VYFSDVHAGRDSQFFGAPHDTPDTQTTAAARAGLALDPDNFDLLIELAEALNFQLR
jgi:hypothetical protein